MPDSTAVCPLCGAAAADAPKPALPSTPPPGTGYSFPPVQQAAYPRPTDGQATAAMIFGILGLTCFWGIAGIPAVLLGHLSKSNIRKSAGQLDPLHFSVIEGFAGEILFLLKTHEMETVPGSLGEVLTVE